MGLGGLREIASTLFVPLAFLEGSFGSKLIHEEPNVDWHIDYTKDDRIEEKDDMRRMPRHFLRMKASLYRVLVP